MNGTTLSGSLIFGEAVTVELAETVNDLRIPGIEKAILVNIRALKPVNINGIIPADQQLIILFNVGRYRITIKKNSHLAASSNRLLHSSDIILKRHESTAIIYLDKRWRLG